jgi:hypothetical protein
MNASVLCELKPTLWRATRREFTIKSSILSGNITEAPHAAHVRIGGNCPLSTTALNIEAATVPRTMIVTRLTVLRLPARTVGRGPLGRQIPLCDRQGSGQPQHSPTAAQYPRNWLSRLRQHGRFNPTVPTSAL